MALKTFHSFQRVDGKQMDKLTLICRMSMNGKIILKMFLQCCRSSVMKGKKR